MYFVVISVLSLVLAFPRAPYPWLRDPALVTAAVALATLLPAGLAWLVNRGTLRRLDRRPDDPGVAQAFFGRQLGRVQMLIAIVHCAIISATAWLRMCHGVPVVGDWPGVGGTLAALPTLATIVLVWLAVYPADRAIRQIALEVNIHRGRPVHPVWTLGQFVGYSLRHQVLFIVIPMIVILVARDVIGIYDRQIRALFSHEQSPDLLLGAIAGLVAVVAPWMLRYVWVTQPLPDSPLRRRLLELCRLLRIRCQEILIWRSGGMVVNAAVMGVLPPLRYVMITDAMLEQMEDRKIEAVFGHESGHVKRHHIAYFLLFAFISGCLLTVAAQWTRGVDRRMFQIIVAVGGAIMLFKWGVLFGWISRQFERQADLYGVRTLAFAGLDCERPCALHAPGGDAKALGDPLCQTAAHVFADTLHEVALLNGIPPEANSWRHGSIHSRSMLVEQLAGDPLATARFERKIGRIKAGILAAAVLSAAWAVWSLKLWTILGL